MAKKKTSRWWRGLFLEAYCNDEWRLIPTALGLRPQVRVGCVAVWCDRLWQLLGSWALVWAALAIAITLAVTVTLLARWA